MTYCTHGRLACGSCGRTATPAEVAEVCRLIWARIMVRV